MAQKYGIRPRPFSFSLHEIKVRIDTRYAVWINYRANVAPKSDLVQLGSAHEWMKRLNRASPAAGHPTYHDVNVIKLK